jgi:hypothetical protein
MLPRWTGAEIYISAIPNLIRSRRDLGIFLG